MLSRYWPTAFVLAVAASFAVATGAVAKDKKKHDRAQGPHSADSSGHTILVDGVSEPSGIALHTLLHHLFVVGDDGMVGEMDRDGRTIRADSVPGNLEDLAFHPPSGMLVLLVESPPGLVVYDAAAHRETRRIALNTPGLLGPAAYEGEQTQGFEGLAFRPGTGRPGGGVFYLAHQRTPAMVVVAAFDPLQVATVGKEAVVERWTMDPYRHLTAISWDAALNRFLLIADHSVAVLTPDGKTESRSGTLPMLHPEGICVDEAGSLWIADDPTGLTRYRPGELALTPSGQGGTSPRKELPWP